MSKSSFAFLLALLLAPTSIATQAQTTWISGVTTSTTSTTASVSWNTAVPTTTEVQYGLTTGYGTHTTLDSGLANSHAVNFGGLTAGTVYHLRLLSKDAEPLLLTSKDFTITTQASAVSVTVSPTSGAVASGGSEQFTAQVTNTTNTGVGWTASIGSITAAGLFTAPMVSTDQAATVTATSTADPSKSATASLTVKAMVRHSVSLNWQTSPSNDIVFYNAYRSCSQGGPYALMASAITGLAYADSSVQAGITYYYVVTATDEHGEESADSGEAAASVPSP
jgi:hypothetical protein